MNRRQLLAVVGASLIAGCPGDPRRTATRSETPRPTTSKEHQPATSGSRTPNGCTATSVYSLHNGRLSIESTADVDLAVTTTLVDGCTAETVLDRTRTFSPGDSVNLDSSFELGRPYDFTLAIDGVVRFEETILDYEGYELAIRSKNEVEITEYVVA